MAIDTLSVGLSSAAAPPQNTQMRKSQQRGWRPRFFYSWVSSDYCRLVLPHLITLSALVKTLGGIVRPICLAVFRLIISSNFFGCSTGRSAGLLPFRILSTYVGARRYKSVKLTP